MFGVIAQSLMHLIFPQYAANEWYLLMAKSCVLLVVTIVCVGGAKVYAKSISTIFMLVTLSYLCGFVSFVTSKPTDLPYGGNFTGPSLEQLKVRAACVLILNGLGGCSLGLTCSAGELGSAGSEQSAAQCICLQESWGLRTAFAGRLR